MACVAVGKGRRKGDDEGTEWESLTVKTRARVAEYLFNFFLSAFPYWHG
jgi:hypothetical protein